MGGWRGVDAWWREKVENGFILYIQDKPVIYRLNRLYTGQTRHIQVLALSVYNLFNLYITGLTGIYYGCVLDRCSGPGRQMEVYWFSPPPMAMLRLFI